MGTRMKICWDNLEKIRYSKRTGKWYGFNGSITYIDTVAQNPMFQNDMDSCITLCKNCHKEVHKLPDCGYHELRCKK